MEIFLVYAMGTTLYPLLEILWRGQTHWSMALCGGLCFVLMYLVSQSGEPMSRQLVLSAAGISTVEFLAGCLLNLRLGLGLWDYSDLPYNLMGQVCPRYFLFWMGLSIPGLALCRFIRRLILSGQQQEGGERESNQ